MVSPGVDDLTKARRHAEKLSRQYHPHGWYEGDYSVEGCTRQVSMWENVVFKAHSNIVYCDNKLEWKFYNSSPSELREMCAKPLYISKNGRVLVMERIPSTLKNDELWYSDYLDKEDALDNFNHKLVHLINKVYGKGVGLDSTDDNHSDNVGVTKTGELKWIDYAGYNGG
jgi:hypothetical protein